MIKVQSLRLRGLCASSLLALAACSGAPTEVDVQTTGSLTGSAAGSSATGSATMEGTPLTSAPGSVPGSAPGSAPGSQDPQGQQDPQPQGTRDRVAMVEKLLAAARRSLELSLFTDARNEAAYALELDGTNQEARQILDRCEQVLGRSGAKPIRSIVDDTILGDRIRMERERSQAERDLSLGRAHLQSGQIGRAIESFERAVTVLRFSPYVQANDALRKTAEAELQNARDAKAKGEQEAADQARLKSIEDLDRLARDQKTAREGQVTRLLEAANVQFQDGNYSKTVSLLDQALLLDPVNPDAQALRDLADRARHNSAMDFHRDRWRTEWSKTFQELQQSTVPQSEVVNFDPIRWSEVNQRKPMSYSAQAEAEAPENAKIRQILAESVSEHLFSSATVQDWASNFERQTNVTFFVSEGVRALEAEKTTITELRLPRMSVADALKRIALQTGVGYRIKDGMVYLVTEADNVGDAVLQNYIVTELVTRVRNRPGPDLKLTVPGDDSPVFAPEEESEDPALFTDTTTLIDLVKNVIKDQSGVDRFEDGKFSITSAGEKGPLVVLADRETHEQVDKLLRNLRKHVGIQVDVESRFLKVEDSFLEDVGIDLRGLGNQSSNGLAGRGLEKKGARNNAGFDDYGPRQNQNPAVPGVVGTGTSPGVFFDDGEDGDGMARVENLYNQTLGGRNNGLTNAGGLSLQYAFLDDTEVEVVLRAVSKQERSEQIDAPRLLVYNNARAHMLYLRQIAYIRDFEVEIAQAAAVANPVIGTVYDGVTLDVRPIVDSELKFITMDIRPTVMTLQLPIPTFTTTLGVGQPISIQLPETTRQTVRTTLTMPDGGTVMLGGMRLVERQNLRSTVPLLGSIPGLSWLFSRNGQSVQNRKIIILVTAKIVLMEEHEPNPASLPGVRDISMAR
jgi:tetratricopeptide (TPR) repeat protein